MEIALCCVVSMNPFSWSQQLLRVEYTHNSLQSSTTSPPHFQCAYSSQLLLFPALEGEVSCPSAQAFVRCCRRIWAKAHTPSSTLCVTALPRPSYCHILQFHFARLARRFGSTQDLPLQVKSKKLARRFVGPFPIQRVISPMAVKLKLPLSIRIRPTFHFSKLKPVADSPISSFSPHRWESSCLCSVPDSVPFACEGCVPEERSWVPACHIVASRCLCKYLKGVMGGSTLLGHWDETQCNNSTQ